MRRMTVRIHAESVDGLRAIEYNSCGFLDHPHHL